MAELGNEIRLCTVNPTAFLGVSEGRNENEVVVSNTRTTVTVYEVKERKAITNFNTRGSDALVSSVVFCAKQNRYVAALNNNKLRVWTSEESCDIRNGKKIKIQHDVDSLWSPSVRSDPLIVYKNGAIEQLTSSNEKIVAVKEIGLEETHVSFVDVLSCGDLIHVAYAVTTEKKEVVVHNFVIGRRNETYVLQESYISPLSSSSNESSLIGLRLICTSDGVKVLRLETDGKLHIGVLETTNKSIKWSFHRLRPNFDESKLTAMIPLKSHVVIALERDEGKVDCTVYNLRYGAPTHNKLIVGCKNLTALKFYKANDNLLLHCGEGVYLIPYSYESVELSQVVGTRTNVRINDDEVNYKAQNLKWTAEGLKEDDVPTISKRTKHEGCFSREFVKFVTEIESGCTIDHEACSRMFNELTKAQKFEMLGEALTYYKNVPERTLVNVLASYLSYEDEQNHLISNYHFDKSSSCEIQMLPVVDQILTLPINDLFLQEHVRRLPFEQVIFVDWISILIDAHFQYLTVMKNDAVHGFLRDLQSTVVNQCEVLDCLAKIQELILIVKCRGKTNYTKNNNGYGIETLHFV